MLGIRLKSVKENARAPGFVISLLNGGPTAGADRGDAGRARPEEEGDGPGHRDVREE